MSNCFDVKPSDPQALLDIYLLDNIDEAAKHAIVSFLLLRLIKSFVLHRSDLGLSCTLL